MEKLIQYSNKRISNVDVRFKRYLWHKINWSQRLIVIKGFRGIGKTTFLLQYINENVYQNPDEVLFVNADDLYFAKNNLIDFADHFVKRGGKYLFIDEIHKYDNWSQEIKNMYDYFSELHIVITGSSALNIYKGKADLSRRAITYKMHTLSFREFIELKYDIPLPVLSLDEIMYNHIKIASMILKKIKPLKIFDEYLQYGCYPLFVEGIDLFKEKLNQIIHHVLETDLPAVEKIGFNSVYHIKKLVSVIAEIVPYKPNISKLSQQVEVSRETLLKYLYLLSEADIFMLLNPDTYGISKMNKPDKIYLENPNLVNLLSPGIANPGTIRETFFYNQLKESHTIKHAVNGDFIVDNKFTFEIGGKNKTKKQIQQVNDAYIAVDNIEYGAGNRIPVWLFGFLY